jgi:hypothetical protein
MVIFILFLLWQQISFQCFYWKKFIIDYLKKMLTVIAITFILGGFWYMKNFYYYRNPLWPITISLANHKIFDGLIEEKERSRRELPPSYIGKPLWKNIWNSFCEKTPYYNYDSRQGGLGAVWFIFGIPALILSIIISFVNKNYLMAGLVLLSLLGWLIHPLPWWPRYSLFLAGIGSISTVYLLQNQFNLLKTLLCILLLISAGYNIIVSFDHSYYPPNAIKKFIHLPASQRNIHNLFTGCYANECAYKEFYWLTQNKVSKIAFSENISYTYLLWGKNFSNRVYYFKPDNEIEWKNNLIKNKIDYLFITQNSYEKKLVSKYPEFRLIYKDDKHEIYKLR